MKLETITETVGKYPIKNLRFISLDNIIVGQVLCPIFSNPNIHDGYCTIQWNKHGFPLKKYKGMDDFKIDLLSLQ